MGPSRFALMRSTWIATVRFSVVPPAPQPVPMTEAVAGELTVERCWIIHENRIARGCIWGPLREQVQEMTVVNAKQWRKIARLAAGAGVGMRPVRTPQNPVRVGFDQRPRQRHQIGIIGRLV